MMHVTDPSQRVAEMKRVYARELTVHECMAKGTLRVALVIYVIWHNEGTLRATPERMSC